MPRPKDKKFLTTEDQERIDDVRLARQNNRLLKKSQRKSKLRTTLNMRPQNRNGRFQQKLQASNRAFDRLQTRESPTERNPDRRLLPKTLSGLGGGGRRSRQVARAEIKDIKWAAKNAGPILEREVRQPYKSGGTKKKKALKKATATYRNGGFIEPPIEYI